MSYHFDQAAISCDKDQNGLVAGAVGEAILREAQPTKETTVFEYGCGTGLVSLFLRPYVASVVAAENSPAMLAVLAEKIRAATLTNIRTAILNLEEDVCPSAQ